MMSKHTILIVDDTAANIRVLAGILENEYEILVATSGKDAITLAKNEEVDLVLLDVMMPEMDGYEVCKILKSSTKTSKIPVIFVTALNSTEAEVKGLQIGAVDFISKPFNALAVQARVRTHIKLYKQTLLLEEISKKDGLTGISNRREYDEKIQIEWSRAQRNGTELSMLMMDIDFFKQYNDTYGHGMGDECLRKISHAIDKMPKRAIDLFARYGGEEFVLLLPDTPAKSACDMAQKIQNAIAELQIAHKASSVNEYVTLSIGIASMLPKENEIFLQLQTQSDEALYSAKNQGRNRYICATSS